MPQVKQTDYIFASARVRASEQSLLNKDKINRMIEAKSPEDALKILDYGNNAVDMRSAGDFEMLLDNSHKSLYDFITSIAPDPKVFDLFLYRYDYHNLKALIKTEQSSGEDSAILFGIGTIPESKLYVMFRERNFISMTKNMRTGVNEAIDTFARTRDPQTIDLILDKYCYKDVINEAKRIGNNFLSAYIRLLIDSLNLKSFMRIKKMEKPWDFFKKVLIEDGNIDERLFFSSYDEPLEQFAEKLRPFGFGKAMSEGAESLKTDGKFTRFEKLCDDRLIEHVKTAKYVSFGLEPLVGYFVAKENDIKTARIIMAGKLANLPSEVIRERLRESYV